MRIVRRRAVAVAVAVALAAAGGAAAVAFDGRAPGERAYREGVPPLAIDPFQAASHGSELAAAAELYAEGRLADAATAFRDVLYQEPTSIEAAIGDALARWPAGTTARLRTIAETYPESGSAWLNLGLALFWEGAETAALAQWQRAVETEPDSSAALRAESLLHPELAPGRPIFVPDVNLPPELGGLPLAEQIAGLRTLAETDRSVDAWILYGVALQRAGRPVSAAAAYAEALAADPENVAAKVADAIGRFTKDDPSQAFSRLGPLVGQHPDRAVVTYHIGLALVWLRELETARVELEKAVAAGQGDFYAVQAQDLLGRLATVAPAAPSVPQQP